MRVLLIDSDEYYHYKFGEIFAPAEVYGSRFGGSASSLVRRHRPDAVITELLLADCSGYEILEELRTRAEFRELPIIIFSQVDNLEDVQTALRLGATAYFLKGRDRIEDIFKLLFINSQQKQYDYI